MRVTVQFRSRVLKIQRLLTAFFMPVYHVYILFSARCDRYYIGSAEDVSVRLLRHNAGGVKSTKNCIPWEAKYFEVFDTRAEALKRELALKRKKSRVHIEWLIKNPHR